MFTLLLAAVVACSQPIRVIDGDTIEVCNESGPERITSTTASSTSSSLLIVASIRLASNGKDVSPGNGITLSSIIPATAHAQKQMRCVWPCCPPDGHSGYLGIVAQLPAIVHAARPPASSGSL